MIYRQPSRKWTIEVSDDPGFAGDHYEIFWRDTVRLGRPCELFTIISDRNPDHTFVQVLLFEDGSTQTWAWHPAMIQISPEQMLITIGLLKPEDCVFDHNAAPLIEP